MKSGCSKESKFFSDSDIKDKVTSMSKMYRPNLY